MLIIQMFFRKQYPCVCFIRDKKKILVFLKLLVAHIKFDEDSLPQPSVLNNNLIYKLHER